MSWSFKECNNALLFFNTVLETNNSGGLLAPLPFKFSLEQQHYILKTQPHFAVARWLNGVHIFYAGNDFKVELKKYYYGLIRDWYMLQLCYIMCQSLSIPCLYWFCMPSWFYRATTGPLVKKRYWKLLSLLVKKDLT